MENSEIYCYVCFEETDVKSPCKCENYLCNNCYNILTIDYCQKECSICKSKFPIENFEIELENLDDENSFYNLIKKIFSCFVSLIFIILFGNLYLNLTISDKIHLNFTFNIEVLFSGIFIYFCFLVCFMSFCKPDYYCDIY